MSELGKLAEELERLRDEAVAGEYDPSKMVALQMKAAFHIDTIIRALRAAEAGRAAGLEEAAKICDAAIAALPDPGNNGYAKMVRDAQSGALGDAAKAIRALSLPKHG